MRSLLSYFANLFSSPDKTKICEIGDAHEVYRWIIYPRMYDQDQFIWKKVFEFSSSNNQKESVVWSGGISNLQEIHKMGKRKARQERKLKKNRSLRYRGYIDALVGEIRKITNKNGHSFEIEHVPSEGYWHAHIRFDPSQQIQMTRPDRNELKFLLQKTFGELVPVEN